MLGKYDWQRCSPAVLASMCDQGQEKIAWALAQHMTWLPLQHLLGLAFRCAKYRHCLSLLDSMARAGAGSLRALAERYKSHAVRFEPLTAANVESKMRGLCEGLEKVYGSMPFARKEWGTSILGTLVGGAVLIPFAGVQASFLIAMSIIAR